MSDETPSTGRPEPTEQGRPEPGAPESGALLSRLRVIEDQPLASRAEALAQLHDELRAQLEAGDAPPHA